MLWKKEQIIVYRFAAELTHNENDLIRAWRYFNEPPSSTALDHVLLKISADEQISEDLCYNFNKDFQLSRIEAINTKVCSGE